MAMALATPVMRVPTTRVSMTVMQTVTDASGSFQVPNPPYVFQDGSVGVSSNIARVGEHSREILTGLCELDGAAVETLIDDGMVTVAD